MSWFEKKCRRLFCRSYQTHLKQRKECNTLFVKRLQILFNRYCLVRYIYKRIWKHTKREKKGKKTITDYKKNYVISSTYNYRFLLNLVWTPDVDSKHTRSDQSRELPFKTTMQFSAVSSKKEYGQLRSEKCGINLTSPDSNNLFLTPIIILGPISQELLMRG